MNPYTLAYLNTKEEKYLRAAERIAGYFTAHIRPDGLTDSDFCQPAGEERIDNLAGAIGACGLMELLLEHYPQTLENRYRIKDPEETEGYALLELAGRRRGFLVSGG